MQYIQRMRSNKSMAGRSWQHVLNSASLRTRRMLRRCCCVGLLDPYEKEGTSNFRVCTCITHNCLPTSRTVHITSLCINNMHSTATTTLTYNFFWRNANKFSLSKLFRFHNVLNAPLFTMHSRPQCYYVHNAPMLTILTMFCWSQYTAIHNAMLLTIIPRNPHGRNHQIMRYDWLFITTLQRSAAKMITLSARPRTRPMHYPFVAQQCRAPLLSRGMLLTHTAVCMHPLSK